MAWLKKRFGFLCAVSYFLSVTVLCASAQEEFRKPENLKKYSVKLFPPGGDEPAAHFSREYDERGNIAKEAQIVGGKERVISVFENDYDGDRLVEVRRKYPNGALQSKSVTKYGDKKSRTVTESFYLGEDVAISIVKSYNSDGRLIGEALQDNVNESSGERVYEYSEDGKLKRMSQTYGDKKMSVSYSYDGRGYLVETKDLDADGKQTKRQSYKRNEKGDVEEHSQLDSEDNRTSKITYSYKYGPDNRIDEVLAFTYIEDSVEPNYSIKIVFEHVFYPKK